MDAITDMATDSAGNIYVTDDQAVNTLAWQVAIPGAGQPVGMNIG